MTRSNVEHLQNEVFLLKFERDEARARAEKAEGILRVVLALQDFIPHEVVRDAERYFDKESGDER